MATFSKSTGTLFALASTAASSVAISSALDVSTAMGGLVYVRFGRRSATAAGAGVNIRLEASFATSGNNTWVPFAQYVTAFAACTSSAISGTEAAGETVLGITLATGFAAGDIIYIDNTTIANSEWARVVSSDTVPTPDTITVEEATVNAQTGSTVYDAAEIYTPAEIPAGAVRIRLVADGSLFTQAFALDARYSLITGIA